ncbi:type II secretion system protein [Shewanella woodyi]|uniref:Methylation site containing protein n=1 Tax=Shewanella woodyi (strain ATCC 51908 / MS32) TaxID=392500 RepID=B1KK30_SHEWM|nr:prepilin-type N-terminal cleavage/methylation domain-containing protein [Shewanella woodyi]ACA88661.1 methylation site containing protein [Shewanella woodyi ATCC 51908]
MKNQKGFTLIELVVVIIILGILAVTAAPKFINLQSDARASTLDGMKGALQGANTLLYSKAAIQGKEKDANTADANNVDTTGDGTADIKAVYGYVKADATEIAKVLESDGSEWTIVAPATGVASTADVEIIIHPADITPSATKQCFVEYTGATATDLPVYGTLSDDC